MQARVSHIESFRQWKGKDELDIGWLAQRVFGDEETPAMRAGTAFHKALELAEYGEYENLSANGYTFQFGCDCELQVPKIREIRGFKKYGELEVTGQCDGVDGRLVLDYKTTANCDSERFDRLMSGYQWRYYLDIFNADVFLWHIFEIREMDDPNSYLVSNYHQLEQRRYPDLHSDCAKLADEYLTVWKQTLSKVVPPKKMTLEEELQASLAQMGISQADTDAVLRGEL